MLFFVHYKNKHKTAAIMLLLNQSFLLNTKTKQFSPFSWSLEYQKMEELICSQSRGDSAS